MKSLSEPLNRLLERTLSELRVSIPARVESYDHTQQRASVQPLLRRVYKSGDVEDMPIIADVPVVFPRSGGASLTMPVNRGDGVLLVFSDRSIDRWLQQGDQVTPDDPRKHDLSDAIAIPGLYSFSDEDASPSENNDDVLLQYDGSAVRLQPGGNVEVETATSVTVNTGQVTVSCDSAEVNADDVEVNADLVEVTSPQSIFNGNVLVNGSIAWTGTAQGDGGSPASFSGGLVNTGGDVTSDGISLTTHTHGGVESGGDTSGPPQ